MGRKRNRDSVLNYFTKETENYIIAYNSTDCKKEKEMIFKNHIYEAFYKIVLALLNKYRFDYIKMTKEELIYDVMGHMLLKIHMYKEDNGKAFSYFSVMAKNYLIQANNKSYKEHKHTSLIDDVTCDDDNGALYNKMSQSFDCNLYEGLENCDNVLKKLKFEFMQEKINKIRNTSSRTLHNTLLQILDNSEFVHIPHRKALIYMLQEKHKYDFKIIRCALADFVKLYEHANKYAINEFNKTRNFKF